MRGWIWLTQIMLMFSSVWIRGGGNHSWIGFVPFLTALGIKGKNLKKIREGAARRYIRRMDFVCILYLGVIALMAVVEKRISVALYIPGTLLFILGTIAVSTKWANDCLAVLERFYPWIAEAFQKDFPHFDQIKQQERAADLDEKLNELYQKISNPVVKEAIEKREAGIVIWVLAVDSLMTGMILVMLLCGS